VLLLVAGALLGGFDAVDDGLCQIGGSRLVGTGVLDECSDQRHLVPVGGVTQLASRSHDGLGFCAVLVGAVRPENELVIGRRDSALAAVDRVGDDLRVAVSGDGALQLLHVCSFYGTGNTNT